MMELIKQFYTWGTDNGFHWIVAGIPAGTFMSIVVYLACKSYPIPERPITAIFGYMLGTLVWPVITPQITLIIMLSIIVLFQESHMLLEKLKARLQSSPAQIDTNLLWDSIPWQERPRWF